MTLTIGTGPFGDQSTGTFNFDVRAPQDHALYLEESPKRVRVVFGGEVVADSYRAKLLHEAGLLPIYYFPQEGVRMDLLEETDHTTHCPFKGDASYFSFKGGPENAVWSYEQPYDEMMLLKDRLAFYPDKVDSISVSPATETSADR